MARLADEGGYFGRAVQSLVVEPRWRQGPVAARARYVEPLVPKSVWLGFGGVMSTVETSMAKAKTGVWGRDDVLAGGFLRDHLFLLLRGVPALVGGAKPLLEGSAS
jgi:hypothetical protein